MSHQEKALPRDTSSREPQAAARQRPHVSYSIARARRLEECAAPPAARPHSARLTALTQRDEERGEDLRVELEVEAELMKQLLLRPERRASWSRCRAADSAQSREQAEQQRDRHEEPFRNRQATTSLTGTTGDGGTLGIGK